MLGNARQLRPLLDNIGGNGVHIEMDFHNEDEVEKAMRIVEEYQEDEAKKPQQEDNTIRINSSKSDADKEVEAIIESAEREFKELTGKDEKGSCRLARRLPHRIGRTQPHTRYRRSHGHDDTEPTPRRGRLPRRKACRA